LRLAIAGASGFIGLNVVEQALAAGRDVVAFDLQPIPDAARALFASLPGRLAECVGDIQSAADRRAFLGDGAGGVLIQAAAITPDATRERAFPGSILAVNSAAALDCVADALASGFERIVAVSSVSAYGMVPADMPAIPEDQTLAPFNLYGLSKLAFERGLARLHELRPFDLRIARLSPQFGRWEWRSGKRDALSALLEILATAQAGREAVLPREVEIDWLYAADAARGLLVLADTGAVPHAVFNIGSGRHLSLAAWCSQVATAYPGFRWRFADAHAKDANIVVNPGFVRPPQAIGRMAEIGWHPSFDLAAAFADYQRFAEICPAFSPLRQGTRVP
jgi:nucleoside-diphosphate-sugar epimerase